MMKKTRNRAGRITAAVLAITAIFCMCGCESMNSAISDLAADKGKITLGDYKGVEISPELYETKVTDEDVENYIESLIRKSYTGKEVSGRPVKTGDTVNISFTGYLDGETFEGGSGDNYDIVIGSGMLIPGFEDGLVGAEKGESRRLELKFPDSYGNTELAGKPVVFDVTVNTIYDNTLPELTDEFAQENFQVESAEELRSNVRTAMETSNNARNENAKAVAAWDAVVKNTVIERYPQDQIDVYIESMKGKYEEEAANNSLSLEDYLLNNYSMTEEQFDSQAEAYAKEQVRNNMIADAIAKQENIRISEDEYKSGLSYYLAASGYSTDEEFKEDYGIGIEEFFGKDILNHALLLSKVMQFVSDNAVEKAAEQ